MEDRTLTLLDTKRAMNAKIVMTNNRMFILNIKTNMPKCLKEMLKGLPSIIHLKLVV